MCTQLSSNAACIMFHPTNKQSQVCCAIVQKRFFLCDIRVRAFIRFLSFFFLFLFHFSSPPPPPPPSPCDECPWADRETQSRCLRKIFFFLVGKSTRFRFLKRVNRRLNRCSRLGADERTIVWSRIGDGVLFDSFILDRAPRVIRFFFREVSERRSRIYGRDFFFFFFSLRPNFENNLTAGILGYSGTVKVTFQYFGTKIELIGINNWSDLWIVSQEWNRTTPSKSKSREQQHVVLCFIVLRF